jgi:phage FluMu protein Com
MTEVRCGKCNKKLADHVEGLFITKCPRCHDTVVVDRRVKVPIH